MIAREKKLGRVRLSTNELKINMADVPSKVVKENLSRSSSVKSANVTLYLLWIYFNLYESETSASMEAKRLDQNKCSRFDGEFA